MSRVHFFSNRSHPPESELVDVQFWPAAQRQPTAGEFL
jgi:hypothetical protein